MTQLTEAQQADKFRNRRRMAWLSFGLLTLIGAALIFYGATDATAASNINAMSFLIGTVFGVWASIVLSYFGAATLTQMNERRYSRTGDVMSQSDSFEIEVEDNR